jgi:hypothetical protein
MKALLIGQSSGRLLRVWAGGGGEVSRQYGGSLLRDGNIGRANRWFVEAPTEALVCRESSTVNPDQKKARPCIVRFDPKAGAYVVFHFPSIFALYSSRARPEMTLTVIAASWSPSRKKMAQLLRPGVSRFKALDEYFANVPVHKITSHKLCAFVAHHKDRALAVLREPV